MTKLESNQIHAKSEHWYDSFEFRVSSFESLLPTAYASSMPHRRPPGFSARRRLLPAETQSQQARPGAGRFRPAGVGRRRLYAEPRVRRAGRARSQPDAQRRRFGRWSSTRAMPTPARASGAIAMRPRMAELAAEACGAKPEQVLVLVDRHDRRIFADGQNRRRHSSGRRQLLGR